jgi:tryptophan synthase alpha chain
MSRYANMFAQCRDEGRIAFGGFLMLGHPHPAVSVELLDALVEGGADMVELGIPFSDPVADGPIIARAAKQALETGVTPGRCLELVANFRARHPDIPIGILTYANIALARGRGRFAAELAAAGVDSLLLADVPSIEAGPWAEEVITVGVDPVLIAAPNTPEGALARIAEHCRGYTYCVARNGVTGSGEGPKLSHGRLFANLARHGAPLPVLGFGLSEPAHVRAAARAGAAGAISGSAIVGRVDEGPEAVRTFVARMVAATALQDT